MEVRDVELVYTAYPKDFAYFKTHILKYVLEQGCVPLAPITEDLAGLIGEDTIEDANRNLVKRCDSVWVFFPSSKDALEITALAEELNKPLRYFSIVKSKEIREIK